MTYAKPTFEEKVTRLMTTLRLTHEEAEKCIHDDEIIDKGGTCEWEVPMTAEQKKMIRQLHGTDRKTGTKTVKREKKVDENKKALIATIANALNTDTDNLVITNDEREMTFNFNGTAYKIVLSAPRTQKAD